MREADPEVAAMIQRLRHSPSYILNRDEARLRDDAADLIERLAREIKTPAEPIQAETSER